MACLQYIKCILSVCIWCFALCLSLFYFLELETYFEGFGIKYKTYSPPGCLLIVCIYPLKPEIYQLIMNSYPQSNVILPQLLKSGFLFHCTIYKTHVFCLRTCLLVFTVLASHLCSWIEYVPVDRFLTQVRQKDEHRLSMLIKVTIVKV